MIHIHLKPWGYNQDISLGRHQSVHMYIIRIFQNPPAIPGDVPKKSLDERIPLECAMGAVHKRFNPMLDCLGGGRVLILYVGVSRT